MPDVDLNATMISSVADPESPIYENFHPLNCQNFPQQLVQLHDYTRLCNYRRFREYMIWDYIKGRTKCAKSGTTRIPGTAVTMSVGVPCEKMIGNSPLRQCLPCCSKLSHVSLQDSRRWKPENMVGPWSLQFGWALLSSEQMSENQRGSNGTAWSKVSIEEGKKFAPAFDVSGIVFFWGEAW